MKRSQYLFVSDILQSIKNVEDFTEGVTKASFLENVEKQSAVIRQIEIIGEAVKNIPPSFREKYPDIPWKDIAGFRDVILHSYFRIDPDILWKVIKEDLPNLKAKITEVKKDLEEAEKRK